LLVMLELTRLGQGSLLLSLAHFVMQAHFRHHLVFQIHLFVVCVHLEHTRQVRGLKI
jgi:hypothetical protein